MIDWDKYPERDESVWAEEVVVTEKGKRHYLNGKVLLIT